jgi:hypothetical protein
MAEDEVLLEDGLNAFAIFWTCMSLVLSIALSVAEWCSIKCEIIH